MTRRPPRLVVRTLAATFATVATVLCITFVLITIEVRDRVRSAVTQNLASTQDLFSQVERNRQRELHTRVTTLAATADLRATVEGYQGGPRTPADPRKWTGGIQRQVQRVADQTEADVVAVADPRNITLASAGNLSWAWPVDREVEVQGIGADGKGGDGVVKVPGGVFRVVVAPLTLAGDSVGRLFLASSLDKRYAAELQHLTRAEIAIVVNGRLEATTLPARAESGLASLGSRETDGIVVLEGEQFAFLRFFELGDTAFYALESVDAAAAAATWEALRVLGYIGAGAMLLAAVASLWLARTLTRPIDRLSASLSEMATAGRFDERLTPSGTSLELDALATTFNDMMSSLAAAQAETQGAYLGAIRALAMTLDARDPYTAGHSERVATLSVSIGRQMGLPSVDLDILRLGALLHDIGKIGLSDDVLRKPDRLTDEEFELIKMHPTLGARILKSVPFLAPHLPIVELHHERLDGKGYPQGLRGDETPLLARIVHVADAYDAITSARAYRFARSSSDAIAELWHCRGSDFDPAVVDAFIQVLPAVATQAIVDDRNTQVAVGPAPKPRPRSLVALTLDADPRDKEIVAS
jgi:putative nucleotidyltransferase with HDIG domain